MIDIKMSLISIGNSFKNRIYTRTFVTLYMFYSIQNLIFCNFTIQLFIQPFRVRIKYIWKRFTLCDQFSLHAENYLKFSKRYIVLLEV